MDGRVIAGRGTLATVDSGVRGGAENLAIDRKLLALHAAGKCPDLLRFYRSRPTACVGRHQAIDRELRLDYCRARGIATARRASGGGALYLDQRQLGISLVAGSWVGLGVAGALERMCHAVAAGLARLGVAAAFKFPNDLEVGGRKIASVFAARCGDSLLLQAVLLLDADIEAMLEALRVPTEKLSADGLADARRRLTSLRRSLGCVPPPQRIVGVMEREIGAALGLACHRADAGTIAAQGAERGAAAERAFAHRVDWSEDGPAEAVHRTPGGLLRARVRIDAGTRRVAGVQLAGDVHLQPAGFLERLERALDGVHPHWVRPTVGAVSRRHEAEFVGFDTRDLAQVLHLALEAAALEHGLGLEAGRLMVYGPDTDFSADAALAHAGTLLVPYCAKPTWCKWRHRDGCPECGRCEVGEAYGMARERGMAVVTVTGYGHLRSTLAAMGEQGARAYVGMCCGSFFAKRQRAFQEAGIPAVLMDVSGANCYELKQEGAAYAGRFQAQARLDVEPLRRVMARVPIRAQCGAMDKLGKE